MSITLWKPEPDVLIHQALGKLAEECAELSQALARCLIQGYHEDEPVTHKLNRIQVREEMADVKAAMRWLSQLVGEEWGESPREARKLAGFQQWQHMLEADAVNQAPALNARGNDAPLTISLPVHQIAHDLLKAHTGQEGGCPKIDWYRLRSEISDAIAVALDNQRKIDKPPTPNMEWQVVPKRLTAEMMAAACKGLDSTGSMNAAYELALEAAPAQKVEAP